MCKNKGNKLQKNENKITDEKEKQFLSKSKHVLLISCKENYKERIKERERKRKKITKKEI